MNVDSKSVQDFVDQSVDEYKQKTIIGDVIEATLQENLSGNSCTCRANTKMELNSINNGSFQMHITNLINQITSCENKKIVKYLYEESELEQTIDTDKFSKNLYKNSQRCLPHSSNIRLLLPNHFEYKDRLYESYGMCDNLAHANGPPIYWFDPDIFGRKGIVINSYVRMNQEKHGDRLRIVDENMDSNSLPSDNSENCVNIHIGDKGRLPIEINIWSKFSQPQTIDEDSICILNLPNHNNI